MNFRIGIRLIVAVATISGCSAQREPWADAELLADPADAIQFLEAAVKQADASEQGPLLTALAGLYLNQVEANAKPDRALPNTHGGLSDSARIERAQEYLDKALATGFDRGCVYYLLAVANMNRGDNERALALAETAVAKDATIAEAHRLRAAILSKEQPALAVDKVRESLLAHPDDGDLNALMALNLMETGDFQAALPFAEKAVSLEGSHVQRLLLSRAYFRTGNIEQAEDLLRDLLEEYPDDVNSAVALSTIREKQGNLEGARSIIAAMQSRQPSDARLAERLTELQAKSPTSRSR